MGIALLELAARSHSATSGGAMIKLAVRSSSHTGIDLPQSGSERRRHLLHHGDVGLTADTIRIAQELQLRLRFDDPGFEQDLMESSFLNVVFLDSVECGRHAHGIAVGVFTVVNEDLFGTVVLEIIWDTVDK